MKPHGNGINKLNINKIYLVLLGFGSIVLLRVIPHIANCVPIFALLTWFTGKYNISKKTATLLTLAAILTSDLLLHVIYGYPIIGAYSLFTYSGFALVVALQLPQKLLANTIVATTVYWLWTNLGVWLVDGMYQINLEGLSLCYAMALPFLKYSLLANTVGAIIFTSLAAKGIFYHLSCLNTSQRNRINNIFH